MQDQDYEYFLKNMEELYKQHGHKFLSLKNQQVLGVYDSFQNALAETLKHEEYGTFLIQECFQNKEECVQYFQRNVIPVPI
jgi:hypothetical protein